jgi:uncharacterized membrane protein YeiH
VIVEDPDSVPVLDALGLSAWEPVGESDALPVIEDELVEELELVAVNVDTADIVRVAVAVEDMVDDADEVRDALDEAVDDAVDVAVNVGFGVEVAAEIGRQWARVCAR